MGYYFTYKISHLFHREIPGFQRHLHYKNGLAWFGFMVLITTFNNISAILWRSVLLVEETTDLLQVQTSRKPSVRRSGQTEMQVGQTISKYISDRMSGNT